MVRTNLNPGRKVLKVKPAEKCIIMVLCAARREDILLPLTFLTHSLPACLRNQRQRGEGLAEEQREVCTVSNHLSLSFLYSFSPSPSQCIPNQSAGGAMLVRKTTAF